MRFLRTLAMTFSMFSALPVPQVKWEKENMRYALAALPLVGAVIGALLLLWTRAAEALAFGGVLFAAGFTLVPLAVSGGIHLDGFCDTADALASHAEPEKKRAILKDPHAGAFAVIWVGAYLLAHFALCTELVRTQAALPFAALIPVMSRSCGAFASTAFPTAGRPGLLTAFREAADRRALLLCALWMPACAAAMIALSPIAGGAAVLSIALCLLAVYRIAKKAFGGMSGDLAGFFIALSELVMLAALVFAGKAGL